MGKKKKKKDDSQPRTNNRDLSWLSFNDRVLQEAADERVPLIERLRFLGIFSSNLDEFFRVRVASLRRITAISGKTKKHLGFDPKKVLPRIQKTVLEQQNQFEQIFNKIIRDLKKKGVRHINENELSTAQSNFVKTYFNEVVRPTLVPVMLDKKTPFPELRDKVIYFAIRLGYRKNKDKYRYSIMEIPTGVVSRFLVLPKEKGEDDCVILLDDVIRHCLSEVYSSVFDYDRFNAYTVKLTRDAELDIENDFSQSIVEKITKSLKKRKKGEPVRFVYDKDMPAELLELIMKRAKVTQGENVIPGGKYHNFRDFMAFPAVGPKELVNEPLKPLQHRLLVQSASMFEVMRKKDVLLSFPYQTFNYVIDLLREAAIDPTVSEISINLYRVANQSKIINALINAVRNGKTVTAIIELQARFDEENNIKMANKLQDEGVKVIYGVQGLKVHAKLILITRKEYGGTKHYVHVGTGNFHEKNALIYSDFSLLTSDERITREVEKVFQFFKANFQRGNYRYLMVSPFNARKRIYDLINYEIFNAKRQHQAYIIIKLNNLVDEEMIEKLYEASSAGVKIKLIVRGICCLIPGVKGMSENIEVISIIDRFLEHSRVLIFCNDGNEQMFITSADWMPRNLDFRVEVGVPVFDPGVRKQLREVIDIQLSDSAKARIIDARQSNRYRHENTQVTSQIRSQTDTYKYFVKTMQKAYVTHDSTVI